MHTGFDESARRVLRVRGLERGEPSRALRLVGRLQVEGLRRAGLRDHDHGGVVAVRAHVRVRDVHRAATRVRHLVRVPMHSKVVVVAYVYTYICT